MIVSSFSTNNFKFLYPFTSIGNFCTGEFPLTVLPMENEISLLSRPHIRSQAKRFTAGNLLIHRGFSEGKRLTNDRYRSRISNENVELIQISY